MTTGKKFMGNNQWKKKQLEKKHIQKVATLKKYAKLVKAEGIQSSRVRVQGSSDTNQPPPSQSRSHHNKEGKGHHGKQQLPKPKVVSKEEEKTKIKEELSEKVKKIEESVKKRKQLKRELTKKTDKGQPVMKGKIKNILSKLMNDAGH